MVLPTWAVFHHMATSDVARVLGYLLCVYVVRKVIPFQYMREP